MTSETLSGPARMLNRVGRFLTFSGMVFAAGVLAFGGVGCAEETFKVCECKFACSRMVPDPADPTMTVPQSADLIVCEPRDEGYTYSECGIFCYNEVPNQVATRGAASVPPLTDCQTNPKQDSVLAKNSCSPGWPVGAP